MQSTLQHAVESLATFGIDIDPDNCDPAALRADAAAIRRGETPLHLQDRPHPPVYAADLMSTVAAILEESRDVRSPSQPHAETFTAENITAAAAPRQLPASMAADLAETLDAAHSAMWRTIAGFMRRHNIPGDDIGWSDDTPRAILEAVVPFITGNLPDDMELSSARDTLRAAGIRCDIIGTGGGIDAVHVPASSSDGTHAPYLLITDSEMADGSPVFDVGFYPDDESTGEWPGQNYVTVPLEQLAAVVAVGLPTLEAVARLSRTLAATNVTADGEAVDAYITLSDTVGHFVAGETLR